MKQKLIIALVLSVLSTISNAGQLVSNTLIEHIRVRNTSTTQLAYIGIPECNGRYASFELNNEASKGMFALALTAATTKTPITVEFVESNCSTVEAGIMFIDIAFD